MQSVPLAEFHRVAEMSNPSLSPDLVRVDFMQIASLVLSVYVLCALVAQTIFPLTPESSRLLDDIDSLVCIFFLYDFCIRFCRAESKLKFLRWGWIDFISSIPVLGIFQWARVVRVVRLICILRAIRSTKILVHFLFQNRSRGTLGAAALISVLMVIFSSIAVLNLKTSPDSNIKNPEDALWWAFTTISTVGYGDKFPVTTGGRIVAVLLITAGVGLFGVSTAFIASLFVVQNKEESDSEIKMLLQEVRSLRAELEALNLVQSRAPILVPIVDDEGGESGAKPTEPAAR
jgi:voltage-gated potassium channel